MSASARRDLTLADVEREIGLRGSFYDFVEMAAPIVFPETFVPGWHIGAIGEALEAVFLEQIRKLVVNIPPGCMKSRLVSVLWPVWVWIRDPKRPFLATSFDGDLTYRDAKYSLDLISSEWFQERWGDIVSVPRWAAVGYHVNSAGGWRFATSTGSKGTGRHPWAKVIDDPTKPATVTPESLKETEAYYNNTLRTRGVRGVTVLIMQRLAVNDLAGVMEKEGDAHMLVLPMRFDPERAYSNDPRKTKGELLWPALYGEREVKELEKMPLRDRAAQLDQKPVPEGGAIIKREWIKWYVPGTQPRRFAERAQTWDCAFKDTKGTSKVAGQVWGIEGPDFYFLEGVLDHLDFTKTVEQMERFGRLFPGAGLLVEDKANGSAAINVMSKKVPGVIAIEPEGGKSARLNAVSVIFEGGNVHLPLGNPVAEQLAAHLVSFPAGDCDDDVDACSQLLNHYFLKVVDYAAAMRGLRPGAF